ncbi:MAG TPA: hypothetical protein VEO53_02075, partial [Candidatus Binatia bacterium]|nr:hypothetical protein [Candidatus Binatia bacterium]
MSMHRYRAEFPHLGPFRRIGQVLFACLPLLLVGKAGTGLQAQQGAGSSGERVQLALFPEAQQVLSGALAGRDYFLQLPEHITFHQGSELRLWLHPSPELAPEVCAVRVALNDRTLTTTNFHFHGLGGSDLGDTVCLDAGVPEGTLTAG